MRADRLAVLCLLAFAIRRRCPPDEPYSAILEGHVVIPAETFIHPPSDAPADLKTPGKFTARRRNDAVGSVESKSFERPTGAGPVQIAA